MSKTTTVRKRWKLGDLPRRMKPFSSAKFGKATIRRAVHLGDPEDD